MKYFLHSVVVVSLVLSGELVSAQRYPHYPGFPLLLEGVGVGIPPDYEILRIPRAIKTRPKNQQIAPFRPMIFFNEDDIEPLAPEPAFPEQRLPLPTSKPSPSSDAATPMPRWPPLPPRDWGQPSTKPETTVRPSTPETSSSSRPPPSTKPTRNMDNLKFPVPIPPTPAASLEPPSYSEILEGSLYVPFIPPSPKPSIPRVPPRPNKKKDRNDVRFRLA